MKFLILSYILELRYKDVSVDFPIKFEDVDLKLNMFGDVGTPVWSGCMFKPVH